MAGRHSSGRAPLARRRVVLWRTGGLACPPPHLQCHPPSGKTRTPRTPRAASRAAGSGTPLRNLRRSGAQSRGKSRTPRRPSALAATAARRRSYARHRSERRDLHLRVARAAPVIRRLVQASAVMPPDPVHERREQPLPPPPLMPSAEIEVEVLGVAGAADEHRQAEVAASLVEKAIDEA